jgi:DNA-binding CsgD family transcriptional regulator
MNKLQPLTKRNSIVTYSGDSKVRLAKEFGISRETVHQYLRTETATASGTV